MDDYFMRGDFLYKVDSDDEGDEKDYEEEVRRLGIIDIV